MVLQLHKSERTPFNIRETKNALIIMLTYRVCHMVGAHTLAQDGLPLFPLQVQYSEAAFCDGPFPLVSKLNNAPCLASVCHRNKIMALIFHANYQFGLSSKEHTFYLP